VCGLTRLLRHEVPAAAQGRDDGRLVQPRPALLREPRAAHGFPSAPRAMLTISA
jgi:hypothetical protein